MPTRIIREGIITSEAINSLSIGAELFYRRLMSVADDYGRYFAHPSILRANCFPLKIDSISEKNVSEWLKECQAAGLVLVYDNGKHLEIAKFGQQTRSKSKFPAPDIQTLNGCKANDKQMSSLVGVGDEGVVEDGDASNDFDLFWEEYPNRVGKPKALASFLKARSAFSLDVIMAGLSRWKLSESWIKEDGRFIPHPTTWLNQERFNDNPKPAAVQTPATTKPLYLNRYNAVTCPKREEWAHLSDDDFKDIMRGWTEWREKQ